jgi:hypothetical protein
LLANQKVEIKTDLAKSDAPLAGPLVNSDTSVAAPPSVVRAAAPPPQR